jgi:hypothetical protein
VNGANTVFFLEWDGIFRPGECIDFPERPELIARIRNLLRIKEFEDFLSNHNELLKREVEEKIRQIPEGYIDTIIRLTTVAEYKDEETAAHIRRVGHYCQQMAKHLGWSEEDQETILYASPMHDIGKVGIPLEILLKSTKLTAEEFALVKTRTLIGADILHDSSQSLKTYLKDLKDDDSRLCIQMVLLQGSSCVPANLSWYYCNGEVYPVRKPQRLCLGMAEIESTSSLFRAGSKPRPF